MSEKLSIDNNDDLPEMPSGVGRIRREKIDVDDRRWRKEVKQDQKFISRHIFGGRELSWVKQDQSNQMIADRLGINERFEYGEELLRELKTKLQHQYNKATNETKLEIQGLFEEMVEDPEIAGLLQNDLPEALSNEGSGLLVDGKKVILGIDKATSDLFVKMLEFHRWQWERDNEAVQARLPELRADFSDRVEVAIESGRLPLSVAQVKKRLSEVKVYAGDPLLYGSDSAEGLLGDFSVGTDTIVIPARDSEYDISNNEYGLIEKVYTHEMMHALSGRTINRRYYKDKEVLDDEVVRVGLDYSEYYFGSRFLWLNEAITEKLTGEVLGNKTNSYKKERELFEVMLAVSGISDQVFIDAYFEDVNLDKKGDERVPAFKKLMREVNTFFGPGFLARLDERVKTAKYLRGGFDLLVQELKENWQSI